MLDGALFIISDKPQYDHVPDADDWREKLKLWLLMIIWEKQDFVVFMVFARCDDSWVIERCHFSLD